MKKYTIISTVSFIISIASYITTILLFSSESNNTLGSVFMSVGSVFLCLGIFFSRKQNSENNDDENK